MATIKYNGMELEEITEPQIFDPPETMVVDDGRNGPRTARVTAILPISSGHDYRVLTDNSMICYSRCAPLPEKPAPRRATNRELAKWLAQGNGEVQDKSAIYCTFISFNYGPKSEDNPVIEYYKVRKWDDTEWHEPTVDYMGIEEKEQNA